MAEGRPEAGSSVGSQPVTERLPGGQESHAATSSLRKRINTEGKAKGRQCWLGDVYLNAALTI